MFKHGFPPEWSTLKKLIWLVGSGIAGAAAGIWKTVTGTLIHITDALASPMQKCEVTLEPIQDLHGQDAPYPAGGGVNKLNLADQYVYQAGGGRLWGDGYSGAVNTLTETGFTSTSRNNSYGPKVYAGYYNSGDVLTFVCNISQGTPNIAYTTVEPDINIPYTNVTGTSGTKDGRKYITVTAPSDGYYYVGAYANNTTDIVVTNAELVIGNTVPSSYTPYSNICPITGWTGCEVTRTGANLLGGQKFAEAFSSCNGYTIDTTNKTFTFKRSGQIVSPIKFKDNTQYTFIFSALADVRNNNIRIHYTDGTNTWVDINTTTKSTIVVVSTLGKTVSGISVAWGVYSDTATVWYEESGIFEGVLTADDFEPYQGTTLSVTFPDTVYGGSHEFVSGAGLSDRGIKVFDGSTSAGIYDYPAGNGFYFGIPEMKANYSPLGICNQFKTLRSFGGTGAIFGISGSSYIYIINCKSVLGVSTVNDLLTYLQSHPLQFAFPLYEPTEIQLTPQEISTLKGVNNVWSNSNGDTTIIYKAKAS